MNDLYDTKNRYWVLHEEAIVRALEQVHDGEITPAEAMALFEEHSAEDPGE